MSKFKRENPEESNNFTHNLFLFMILLFHREVIEIILKTHFQSTPCLISVNKNIAKSNTKNDNTIHV